jgi:hypothetical protein
LLSIDPLPEMASFAKTEAEELADQLRAETVTQTDDRWNLFSSFSK